jgi:quercetin dioxygenase-like cupin family protein
VQSESVFPDPITRLAPADIPLEGVNARISQADTHQILFMEFSKDAEVAEHSHEAQWGVVLEGKIDLVIEGKEHTFRKGDRYFIPKGVTHWARIYAGYADITFFDSPDRYKPR